MSEYNKVIEHVASLVVDQSHIIKIPCHYSWLVFDHVTGVQKMAKNVPSAHAVYRTAVVEWLKGNTERVQLVLDRMNSDKRRLMKQAIDAIVDNAYIAQESGSNTHVAFFSLTRQRIPMPDMTYCQTIRLNLRAGSNIQSTVIERLRANAESVLIDQYDWPEVYQYIIDNAHLNESLPRRKRFSRFRKWKLKFKR